MGEGHYWLETLGCPKNQVDSDKLGGVLVAEGLRPANDPSEAEIVVINTCAFIEAARQESIETILNLSARRRPGARVVVTGCLAERYGDELGQALPEVDLIAGFGQSLTAPAHSLATSGSVPVDGSPGHVAPVRLSRRRPPTSTAAAFDLLELARPAPTTPWAYVKAAEGCDRICGFCAIPSFRGAQRSRTTESLMVEVEGLVAGGVKEIVLVAQDLASYGRDRHGSTGADGNGPAGHRRRTPPAPPIAELTSAVSKLATRTRLLYLYPSGLTDELVGAILGTGVPYFDLSLQHVSRPLLVQMRRWGDGERFLQRIAEIREAEPAATFRSSFILGYPGETESDHEALLSFLREAQLSWAGFFPFSPEEGTYAADLPDQVPPGLALERLRECAELQDSITAGRRDLMVGERYEVLVDSPGRGRTVHEAPEIDGMVEIPHHMEPGSLVNVRISASLGTDLVADPT